jgi:DNA polymerase III delta prime subunit
MEQQVERADFVLCVCTETYRRRFDQREEPGRGLGVVWEGGLLRTRLYLDRGENKKVFPLLFAAQDLAHIPSLLVAAPRFEPLSREGYDALYRLLTNQPKSAPPQLGARKDLPRLRRQSLFGSDLMSTALGDPADDHSAEDTAAETSSPLSPYLKWAKNHYDHLNLIGIDAGDVQVRLDDVYVPLRVAHRGTMDAKDRCLAPGIRHSLETSGAGMERSGGQENLELDKILRRGDPPHVLIFGEPGSGKTTALLKLHRMCWKPTELGLPADTVPVFLRLRHLSKPLLDQGLAAFLDHEIREVTGDRLTGFGERLWRHGKLLLLFDGLDEIADEKHRTEVMRHIGWTLEQENEKGLRAVVSCRRVGLAGSDADRACRFQTFEVRPLQNRQIKDLVELWFREMARLDHISQIVADQRAETILQALENRQAGNQQILAMVSNPLLLTLLCVVVLLGNEIPKKRVRFYQQCLDVLLDRWPQFRDRKSPVELSDSRAAVVRLAFFLHSKTRQDDLS